MRGRPSASDAGATRSAAGLTRYRTGLYHSGLEPLSLRVATSAFACCLEAELLPSDHLGHHQPNGIRRTIVSVHESNGKLVLAFVEPELIIEARSYKRAQHAANLVTAALSVVEGGTVCDEITPDPVAPRLGPATAISTGGVAAAAVMAGRASRKRAATNALIRLATSFRLVGAHWMDLHPHRGVHSGDQRDPFLVVGFAQAISAAAGAIEELGLKLRASQSNPSKIDGNWNPAVLSKLNEDLVKLGVPVDHKVLWLLRTTRSRIQKHYAPPTGTAAPWSRHDCRDRFVNVTDAIHYAELLRSKTSVHRYSDLTSSLTVFDVVNVQYLARSLLRCAVGLDPTTGEPPQDRGAECGARPLRRPKAQF